MNPEPVLYLPVDWCPRCGHYHGQLAFAPLRGGDLKHRVWVAPCPNEQSQTQPILARVVLE